MVFEQQKANGRFYADSGLKRARGLMGRNSHWDIGSFLCVSRAVIRAVADDIFV